MTSNPESNPEKTKDNKSKIKKCCHLCDMMKEHLPARQMRDKQ